MDIWNYRVVLLIKIKPIRKNLFKGDYARTRASDSKHLPAVILNVFLVNILGLCSMSLYINLKNKFHYGFY